MSSTQPAHQADPMTCPRCGVHIDFVGTKKFHEGTRWGALGEIGELFVDGIGEEFHPG